MFTAADRVTEVPSERSLGFIDTLIGDPAARAGFFGGLGPEQGIDTTDGLRLSFAGGQVVHLRPSGNAPECRVYAEAGSAADARSLVVAYLDRLRAALG